MSDWLPIETAPKDVPILIHGGEWFGEIAGVGPERRAGRLRVWLVERRGDNFAVLGTDYYSAWVVGPTHWMPLPAPPIRA